jgi:uncharacterized protein (TIGR00730 family)
VKRVCVFSGSRPGVRDEYAAMARALGEELVRRGVGLVYGGASVGLMGVVANAVMAAGGEVIGVLPKVLVDREVAHPKLTKLHVVGSMHERKQLMSELSDGFVAMPGGYGTLDELFEIVTWAQLGIHAKPVALYDVRGFWAPLLTMVEHAVAEGFVPEDQRALLLVEREPARLLDVMASWTPPQLGPKWVGIENS